MSKISYFKIALFSAAMMVLAPFAYVLATDTTNLVLTINPGSLSTSIVDNSYALVVSPSAAVGPVTFSFGCQAATGTLGTSSEKIYITNPDAADNGWTLTAAPSAVSAVWDGAASDIDFNDPASAGCADGGSDADAIAGQLSLDPSSGAIAAGQCSGCTATGITKGSSNAFDSGVTDSVTMLTAAAGSDDVGDWVFTGAGMSQTIPPEQGAANDYDINLVLTVTAS